MKYWYSTNGNQSKSSAISWEKREGIPSLMLALLLFYMRVRGAQKDSSSRDDIPKKHHPLLSFTPNILYSSFLVCTHQQSYPICPSDSLWCHFTHNSESGSIWHQYLATQSSTFESSSRDATTPTEYHRHSKGAKYRSITSRDPLWVQGSSFNFRKMPYWDEF